MVDFAQVTLAIYSHYLLLSWFAFHHYSKTGTHIIILQDRL